MRTRQADLFSKDREYGPNRSVCGGSLSKGKRKIARPLDRKKPVHLILKSSHAKGRLSFLSFKNRPVVEKTFRERAKQFNVTVHDFKNVGNHIHSVVKFKNRRDFQNFLRTVTAIIARVVTGARKGKPFGKRFWDELAFTRVVHGLRDLRALQTYFMKNEIERDIGKVARAYIEEVEQEIRSLRRRPASENLADLESRFTIEVT